MIVSPNPEARPRPTLKSILERVQRAHTLFHRAESLLKIGTPEAIAVAAVLLESHALYSIAHDARRAASDALDVPVVDDDD